MASTCTLPSELIEKGALDPLKQKTIKTAVSLSGSGLFTAEPATLTLHPARADSGIVIRKGKSHYPADLQHVVGTPRCTILGNREFTTHTVEHVLSALYGMGIDNAVLEISGPEIPIMDGSAEPFVEAVVNAGIEELDKDRNFITLETPVSWSKGEVHLVALPASEFRISYTLQFPNSTILHSQYLSVEITPQCFAEIIAPSRTFCLYEEIAPFIESGLIKGGGLSNAVIIKNDVVVNPDGVRFPDEMVRHKILDLIGDLSLLGRRLRAHVIAIRSGHASNVAFGHNLQNHFNKR